MSTNKEDLKRWLRNHDHKGLRIRRSINTNEFRKEHLGEKHDKYLYHPMLGEKENKPNSIKFKAAITKDEEQHIKTLLYKTLEVKGKIERTLIDKPTVDDFIKHIPYRSDVRCIFQIVRMWSQPSLRNPTYGLSLKLTKIEVKEKETIDNVGEFIDTEHFNISSDEELGQCPILS